MAPCFQGYPKIKLHISPVTLYAVFGAATPFVKANVFLPVCAGEMLLGDLRVHMDGFH